MKKPQSAIIFIFITLLIDVAGIGIIYPVIPDLIKELTGSDVSTASEYGGWLGFAYAFMQFIFAPILGNLSDKYGRRPVLLISLLGFGIDYFIMAFAPNIIWLFIGRLVAGVCGASFTTASAYIADMSPPEKRAQNFGLIGAAFGLGFIIGPLCGGLLGQFGPRMPFIIAGILTLVNCLYGYFVLPESLKKENRRPFEWKRANPVGTLLQLKRYPKVYPLLFVLFLIYLAGQSVNTVWGYYGMEKFKWDTHDIGISLAVVGACIFLVQGILIRYTIKAWGESKSVIIGIMFYTIGFFLYALATEGWMMYAFTIVYCLGGVCGPALNGIIANNIPANQQGELQGGLTSLMSLTSIIGPVLMTQIFHHFTAVDAPVYFPGSSMLFAGILMLCGLILSVIQLKKVQKRSAL